MRLRNAYLGGGEFSARTQRTAHMSTVPRSICTRDENIKIVPNYCYYLWSNEKCRPELTWIMASILLRKKRWDLEDRFERKRKNCSTLDKDS